MPFPFIRFGRNNERTTGGVTNVPPDMGQERPKGAQSLTILTRMNAHIPMRDVATLPDKQAVIVAGHRNRVVIGLVHQKE